MRSLEDAFSYDHALVIGIGGSGDVVGTIPTARFLEHHGLDVTIGGVAWEPAPKDPTIGPRSLDEFEHLDEVNETVGLVTGRTTTHDGIQFSEAAVAETLDEPVLLLDITQGVDGMIDGLTGACADLDIDLVIGTDSGGDVLATGDEPGLRSPITDGLALVTLDSIPIPAIIGIFGYGSDGELSLSELNAAISRAASNDGLLGAWGITPQIRTELEHILTTVTTEASRLPVEVARGALGKRQIRDGTVTVDLTPPSTVTFYFTVDAILPSSDIASVVRTHRSLGRIQDALSQFNITTEFDNEARRMANRQ